MTIVLLLVILCANYFFYLIPYYHIHGKFNMWDIGNGLIIISTAIQLFRERNLTMLNNIFSWFIFVYLIIIGVQVSLANIIWGQSLIDSFIAVRHQLYYLSFFLFLLTINTPDKIRYFIKILSFIGFLIVVLAIINYFIPRIFYHQWTYGHGIRGDIKRAFIPGMDIICLLFFWYLSRYILVHGNINLLWIVFYYFAIIFRQTRSRIVVVTFILLSFLLWHRKFKYLITLLCVFVLIISTVTIITGKNIFFYDLKSAVQDIFYQQGTWASRMEQMKISWELFKKHPWTGAATFLRTAEPGTYKKYAMITASTDIGYMAWLKYYGILGTIWLFLLILIFYVKNFKLLKMLSVKNLDIVYFNLLYFTFVILSFVTLNHFMKAYEILLVCFVLSNTVVLSLLTKEAKD